MVQGTTSDAGKSVLVAGLCRVLKRRGVRVVPFKPQNMSLNSAVTKEGGEIGRAQALQAQAAGIEPHTDMNPILLKPSSDIGAQVVVQGRAISNLDAQAYHDYKKVAMDAVLDSWSRLTSEFDFVLVEGAGSPAEINLREGDIANMGFAEATDCPVIIVADIDRGGVFAHLVGTLELLSPSEQKLVKGFVINKFRGDQALLKSGIDWLEKRTNRPVLGVLPYLQGLYLDAEDAISVSQPHEKQEKQLKVVVPVFPRISNHTDFDTLRLHPQVDLHYVPPGETLPAADLIVIPGSKSVRQDLALAREYGWDQAIHRHLRYGGKVIGICAGYQMLGNSVSDPHAVEGEAGTTRGLGVIDMGTELREQKMLRQVSGSIQASADRVVVEGYEIHCGVSTHYAADYSCFANLANGQPDGYMSDDGQVIGTYLHGVFDHPEASRFLLAWAGLQQSDGVDLMAIREQQLDRFADMLEENLDQNFLAGLASSENRSCRSIS